MVWQAKHLGWICFKPLVDALGRKAGKFTQAPLALGQLREYFDPALGNRAVQKPQPTLVKSTIGLLNEFPERELRDAVLFYSPQDNARVQHLEKCRRLARDLRGLDSLGLTGPEAGDDSLLHQLVCHCGQQPLGCADVDAKEISGALKPRISGEPRELLQGIACCQSCQSSGSKRCDRDNSDTKATQDGVQRRFERWRKLGKDHITWRTRHDWLCDTLAVVGLTRMTACGCLVPAKHLIVGICMSGWMSRALAIFSSDTPR